MNQTTKWMSAILAARVATLVLLASVAQAGAPPLTVTIAPETVWVLPESGTQSINFDVLVRNDGEVALSLLSVSLLVFDREGAFVTGRELNDLGMAPSLQTLPYTEVGPGQTIIVFNPFYQFPADVDLASLRFTLAFVPKRGEGQPRRTPAELAAATIAVDVGVKPQRAALKTALALPIKGTTFVWDGHDYYGHHRRFDLTHPLVTQVGMRHNISRYGLDLMRTDAAGRRHQGKGDRPEDYFIYGQTVRAPAAGVVADVIDGRRDSPIGEMTVDYEEFMKTRNLRLFGGNFLVIDHGQGELSYFAHLKPGSIKVAKGDKVAAGQPIAQVGNSGDSLEPHLHYHVMSKAELDCEQLPPVFRGFRRFVGGRFVTVVEGVVNTGDLLSSD